MKKLVVAEFGPYAEDVRPLGQNGRFLETKDVTVDNVANFNTEAEAERAIAAAPNKRPGCTVEIINGTKKAMKT